MRRSLIDIINILGALAVAAVVVFAVYTLFIDKPFFEASSYYEDWDDDANIIGEGDESGTWTSDGAVSSIEIGNVSGRIIIESWNSSDVEVEYIKRGPGKHPEVKIDQDGSNLSVKAVYPRPATNFGSVDFRLKVPSDLAFLEAGSVSGSIEVSGLDGVRQKLKSTSGSVTTDGADDLEISSVSGRLEFSASGDHVTASTTSGGISGSLEKTGASGRIELKSVSGRINLEVPSDINAEVDLHSVSGSVSSELPVAVTETKRNSMRGTIGSGGTSIEMSTVSGAVKLTE